MNLPMTKECQIQQSFCQFINTEVLPLVGLDVDKFWDDFTQLVTELTPINQALLAERSAMQAKINQFHDSHRSFSAQQYRSFLTQIGYLQEEGDDFCIETDNVDQEIALLSGPQLVVPIKNARFALNAANARWGSLYDALYGTDVIAQTEPGMKAGKKYNPARGKHVIAYAKDFLDRVFPLDQGSHHDVESYTIYFNSLLAYFPDGTHTGLKRPCQFVGASDPEREPTSILLKNNGLHVEIIINRQGKIGKHDLAHIDDINIESALSTIMDLEDSIAAVDGDDKIDAYRNWLGLMTGSLHASFEKNGLTQIRRLEGDKTYTGRSGEDYNLHGRSLLLIRNVGHLMTSDLITLANGEQAPEGIIDAVITALIASIEIKNPELCRMKNSRTGSIYIVKPKMHGPQEVAFSCELFDRVECMLGLEPNTIKIGIMDEERRTSLNLKECIRAAKSRVFFINTGFLDRTGDEIHTSMQAGPFLAKQELKHQTWIDAYEKNNVSIGLDSGFSGKAQIGKGMWAMPDEMAQMMEQKTAHLHAGATTAWVPSPTAATLHALHYLEIDVKQQQQRLSANSEDYKSAMLNIPLMAQENQLTEEDVIRELENNIQGILGYVVRWIEMGVGCSKVPDINNTALMEDRATLRISSQHIANWLKHNICSSEQVCQVLQQMAYTVDAQNEGTSGYYPMTPNTQTSHAFQCAKALIFEGAEQPNGYTEPLLHQYRLQVKQ
ncbi:malate synthase G [Vibrio sp. UCD-FRSSP16_10]|uniref:malate synthase G n=1 Tax=unclassified Vibrio TaxID=2614977 RepID=UPI0008012D17|nr:MULTISPECIES: malate synthase G [unclassified Vibrio]OBT09422.1 malate synthase G [Vibrio sp. UCD-FRSSP16_30]OBT22101.1 malate synthase G [Vibrio sp. UCD-FRSSP16_10]